jgi:acetylornithine aminotransferase
MWDRDGNEYLDAYNNVVSIGHGHPRVVDAITRQLYKINTNTRYLQHDVVDFAEDLTSTHGAGLSMAMFTCTGSEANDLALRIARQATGGTGIIVSEYAYHGCTRDVASWSPAGRSEANLPKEVRVVPPPDTFRGSGEPSRALAEHVEAQIEDLRRQGIRLAAFVVDPMFSSDGIFPIPNVLGPAVQRVQQAGGLFVCDEVQSGFGRTGAALWGHQWVGQNPDIATMGKPMGNGMPIGGVVTRADILEKFKDVGYFNTFGGENAPVAAAQAVLDTIRDEDLVENARRRGEDIRRGLSNVIERAGVPADVRGAGMYIGVDLVDDLDTKKPMPTVATRVVNGLRDRHVLISAAGPYGNVLKIRPPLVFSEADVDRLISEFDFVVSRL